MTDLTTTIETIAKNDALKGLLAPLDAFLTTISAPTSDGLVDLGAIDVLNAQLRAALAPIGKQILQDSAGAAKTSLDAAASKAETQNGANG